MEDKTNSSEVIVLENGAKEQQESELERPDLKIS